MKLFLPPIKTRLQLEQDWTFPVYYEGYNKDILRILEPNTPIIEFCTSQWIGGVRVAPKFVILTLPIGTIMVIDRIHICWGAPQRAPLYDFVSFSIKSGVFDKKQFWAKLADVNNMDMAILPEE